MTILELREKRNTAWNAAKAFLDSHRTEKGTLTAEDDATYSRMEQEIADLGKEIARLERQEALEAEQYLRSVELKEKSFNFAGKRKGIGNKICQTVL